MPVPKNAVLLRVFLGQDDRSGSATLRGDRAEGAGAPRRRHRAAGPDGLRPLKHAAHDKDAAPLPGPADRGGDRRQHDKINAFLPVLDGMMGSGLVTLEKVQVLQYGTTKL